ncbi:MAG: hypothetical protein AAB896_03295 [Patescibacteria group bacterium]
MTVHAKYGNYNRGQSRTHQLFNFQALGFQNLDYQQIKKILYGLIILIAVIPTIYFYVQSDYNKGNV